MLTRCIQQRHIPLHHCRFTSLTRQADRHAFDRARKSKPIDSRFAARTRRGVQFEECVNTAKANGGTNADLLAGVKVNAVRVA